MNIPLLLIFEILQFNIITIIKINKRIQRSNASRKSLSVDSLKRYIAFTLNIVQLPVTTITQLRAKVSRIQLFNLSYIRRDKLLKNYYLAKCSLIPLKIKVKVVKVKAEERLLSLPSLVIYEEVLKVNLPLKVYLLLENLDLVQLL